MRVTLKQFEDGTVEATSGVEIIRKDPKEVINTSEYEVRDVKSLERLIEKNKEAMVKSKQRKSP